VSGGDVGLFLVYFTNEERWFLGAPIIPRTTFSDDQKCIYLILMWVYGISSLKEELMDPCK
jgi:hypothetical protein